jgi:hypothetical protein
MVYCRNYQQYFHQSSGIQTVLFIQSKNPQVSIPHVPARRQGYGAVSWSSKGVAAALIPFSQASEDNVSAFPTSSTNYLPEALFQTNHSLTHPTSLGPWESERTGLLGAILIQP